MTVVDLTSRTDPHRAAPGTDAAADEQFDRIVDAAVRCIARWGVAKTTLDDVAREAGCSRATVYRLVPGGRDALLLAVARTEVGKFFTGVGARLAAAATLEDLLVAGITEAARRITEHPALRFLVEHEPEFVLPRLAFHQMDSALALASGFAAPHLGRFIAPAEHAHRVAEWVSRIVVSYTITPSPDVDLTDDESARRLVRSFILPGLTAITTDPTA